MRHLQRSTKLILLLLGFSLLLSLMVVSGAIASHRVEESPLSERDETANYFPRPASLGKLPYSE